MMPKFPTTMPVPVLGQSFKVLTAYSTAVIECQCSSKTVIVLQGKRNVNSCKACGKSYAIADAGPLQIGEALAVPEPDGVLP